MDIPHFPKLFCSEESSCYPLDISRIPLPQEGCYLLKVIVHGELWYEDGLISEATPTDHHTQCAHLQLGKAYRVQGKKKPSGTGSRKEAEDGDLLGQRGASVRTQGRRKRML